MVSGSIEFPAVSAKLLTEHRAIYRIVTGEKKCNGWLWSCLKFTHIFWGMEGEHRYLEYK